MRGRFRSFLPVLLLLMSSWLLATVLSNWIGQSQEMSVYYLKADQVPIFREPGAEAFGQLEVVTEIKVLEQQSEVQSPSTRAEMVGWVRLNADEEPTSLMFTDTESQVRMGTIQDVSQMTVLETILDTTPRWAKVQVFGWVWSDQITPDREGLFAQAIELYQQTCSTCHALHNPDEFRPREWPTQIQNMIELGLVKNVPDSDLNLILKYLQINAAASTAEPETKAP